MKNSNLKLVGAMALGACFVNSAQAVIVTAVFDQNSQSSDVGSIVEVLNTVNSSGGPTASLGYTVSGLTIDSNGTLDDSISFEFLLTATGSTSSGSPALGMGFLTTGPIGVNSDEPNDPSRLDLVGESIAFSLANHSVNLGDGATETANIDFTGFTGLDLNAFVPSGETYNLLGGTSADGTGLNNPSVAFDPHSNFEVEYNSGNGFRLTDIRATFEATVPTTIPEPSAAMLGCVAVIGFMTRRRRT